MSGSPPDSASTPCGPTATRHETVRSSCATAGCAPTPPTRERSARRSAKDAPRSPPTCLCNPSPDRPVRTTPNHRRAPARTPDPPRKGLRGTRMPSVESAGLIYCAEQVNSSGKKILKTRRKVHIADSGIRGAVMSELHSPDDPVQKGYLIESAAYKHTIDYCRCVDPALRVGYMLQAGRDKEIDIVICDRTGIRQLIESKVRNQSVVRDNDLIITAALDH
ncbi:MAG: DUF4143 domain-containing protein, partial [Victivallales bacterium]|nr:DUF4143 domain-containing protein [Victivallales bacterium]